MSEKDSDGLLVSTTRLGDLLWRKGFITSAQRADVESCKDSARFGDIAVERGYCTQSQVDHCLGLQEDIRRRGPCALLEQLEEVLNGCS
jgi:hypothetical protein